MAIIRQQVFIASRFDEFRDLRGALRQRFENSGLPIEIIDLEDGAADDRPVAERCAARVRQADVIILLVGDSYGDTVPGRNVSYTHLEYSVAREQDKIVLPFFVAPSFPARRPRRGWSDNVELAQWQTRILREHTAAFLVHADPDSLADRVFDSFCERFWELAQGGDTRDEDDRQLDSSFLSVLDPSDLKRSDAWPANVPSPPITDLLMHPLETRALERSVYAAHAIEARQPYVAIEHLRKALELRPLHVERSYWLAHLLVATGKPKYCREAIAIARKAANLARAAGQHLVAAACFVVAARGARRTFTDDGEGLNLADAAHRIAPWHWVTSLEMACQHAHRGDAKKAFEFVEEAFRLRPDTILHFDREPSFEEIKREYDDFRRGLRDRLQAQVGRVLTTEVEAIATLNTINSAGQDAQAAGVAGTALQGLGERRLLQLVEDGRSSAERHFALLRRAGKTLRMDARVIHAEREAAAARAAEQTAIETETADLQPRRRRTAWWSAIVGTSTLCSMVAAVLYRDNAFGLIGQVLGFLIGGGLGGLVLMRLITLWKDLGQTLEQNRRIAAEHRDWLRDFDARRRKLAERAREFVGVVSEFEHTVVSHATFARRIVQPLERAQVGQCVRIGSADDSRCKRFVCARSLMPPKLTAIATAIEEPTSKFQLWRVRRSPDSDKPVLCRWAAYFA